MKSTGLFMAISSVVATLMLSGCYDNGDNYCDYYNCNADPSGIYEGYATDSITNQTTPVVAIIDENGDGTLSGQDGTYYNMGVGTSGNSLNGSYQGFTAGSTATTTGSISGGLTQAGLDLNLNGAGNHTVTAVLNFDPVYNQVSSLPTLQGSWSTVGTSYNGIGCASGTANCPPAGSATLSLNIQNAGQFTGTDSVGCTYSGNFSLVDSNFDAYYESFTKTCGSGPTVRFEGLATYFPASGSGNNTVPAQIL
ncbi:MAG TPA: hypothetical protein VN046_09215, partial [Stenotrophobium sp.]|nr:hypothetical protein [Stenotrophobium sp.]